MRKMVFGRKLSRSKKAREALFRSLVRAIILGGKITTTAAKAKAVRGQIDKLVTLAKKGNLSARRRALAYLANDRKATDRLFGFVAKAFLQKTGGYTRTISLSPRRGDGAEMARIEWTEEIVEEKKTETRKETKNDENISSDKKRNK